MSCLGQCNQGRKACPSPEVCAKYDAGWKWGVLGVLLVWVVFFLLWWVISTNQNMGGAAQGRGAHILAPASSTADSRQQRPVKPPSADGGLATAVRHCACGGGYANL